MREPEPMEQIDYGINYRSRGSAASHSEAHSEGGSTAMIIIALIAALVAATLTIKQEIDSNDKIAAAERRMNDKVNAAETRCMDYAYLAKQEARIALEQGQKAESIAKERRK